MNKIKFLLIFFAVWLASSPVLAQTLLAKPTTWSIQTFRHVGIVDQVSRKSIFIDDNEYLLSPSTTMNTCSVQRQSFRPSIIAMPASAC